MLVQYFYTYFIGKLDSSQVEIKKKNKVHTLKYGLNCVKTKASACLPVFARMVLRATILGTQCNNVGEIDCS